MATFAAPIASHSTSSWPQHVEHQQERGFAVLLVSALTLFALAVHGYHPYAEDGGLYMAGVKRLLDPALYPQGTAFVLEPTRFSLFAPLVAGLVRISGISLPLVLFVLYLSSVWATLFAAWLLAERCWPARTARTGAVVLLACWLALPVAGTALLLADPYLTARSLSTPCTMLALIGALEMTDRRNAATSRWRGFGLCIGSLVLAAAMHPLMAAYTLAATLMLCAVRSSTPGRRIRASSTLFPALLISAAFALATGLQLAARPESHDYLRIAMTRTYWFPAAWRWFEWIGLAAPLAILAALGWSRPQQQSWLESTSFTSARQALARMAVITGATAAIIAILFARTGAVTHLVARLQPLRAFQIVYLVMTLALGAALGERLLRRSVWRWATTVLLLGGVMLGAGRTAYPHSNHLEFPWTAPANSWTQAFLWIRANTPKGALFALDGDYINAPGEDAQSFRGLAERSALPDYSKDGGEASIAPELTAAWVAGQQAQRGLSSASDTERIAALAPLGVSWVMLQADAPTQFDCPYANAAVKVCRLR